MPHIKKTLQHRLYDFWMSSKYRAMSLFPAKVLSLFLVRCIYQDI